MSILAIDIGGSAFKYGIVSEDGEIIAKGSLTNTRIGYESFIKILCSIVELVKEKHEFSGVALSIPAIMNPKTGRIISEGSMPYLVDVNLKTVLEEKYKLIVHSENDGNCAALAEVWKGAGKECSDIALVVIGTGVGGAIVKDRHVHPGANFISGEFGYFISDYDFDKNEYNRWSDTGALFALTERMALLKERPFTGKEVFQLAEEGDLDAITEVDSFYKSNAVGLFNIQYMYDPETIVLGGAISTRKDFIEQLELRLDKIFEYIHLAPVRPVLKVAEFGNDANLLGAVYNYLQKEKQL